MDALQRKRDVELGIATQTVSDLVLWLANVTPERVAVVYRRHGEERDDAYVEIKYQEASNYPLSWYLSLDVDYRKRAVAMATQTGDKERNPR